MIKLIIGRLRPNFLAVCRPKVNPFLEVCTDGVVGYVVPGREFECGNEDVKEVDGSRKSFPSGHSSLVFYSMVRRNKIFFQNSGFDQVFEKNVF